jgi:hypothetical protein
MYMLLIVTILLTPGANRTIASYKASAVKIYNDTSSLVCFENKNILLYCENALAQFYAGVKWETTALVCLFRFLVPGDRDAIWASDLNNFVIFSPKKTPGNVVLN